MQSFNFDLRRSAAPSMDDNRSRYIPSSVYSNGPGPAEDSLMTPTAPFSPATLNSGFQEQPRYNPLNGAHPRSSSLLNIHDPVAMHLLTETAIGDSKEYEILSYEEVEQLKKERTFLHNRIDATRRKLALESKLRDAAQSLNRLYSTRDTQRNSQDGEPSPRKLRRSFLGPRKESNDAVDRADNEYAASRRKVEELTQELARLEMRHEEVNRRLLEHTAGILQMTHRGLKKNIRKSELPRSPDSMRSHSRAAQKVEDFDERSLYQVSDHVRESERVPPGSSKVRGPQEARLLNSLKAGLSELNSRLHQMIVQAGSREHFDPPPGTDEYGMAQPVESLLQAQLLYLAQGLNAVGAAQARSMAEAQRTVYDSEDQIEGVNARLHDLLQRTNSVSHSPIISFDESRGKDMQSQLQFSSEVLDRLNRRIETLVEQKDILSTQVQQQREINSKSDSQRDAQIRALTEQLSEAKQLQNIGEQEAQVSRDQLNLLMEQIDSLKQESVLQDQQRGMNVSKALEAEREARRQSEERLLIDLKKKQDQSLQMQADLASMQNNFDIQSQHRTQQINDLTKASQQKDIELQEHRAQISQLQAAKVEAESNHTKGQQTLHNVEAEIVRLQTELTIAKADLDGAYGSRAQRAADVSSDLQKEIQYLQRHNNELQQQLEFLSTQHETRGVGSADLQNRVNSLQRELKDTLEDYELMTKSSIEFEKERDHLEATIDNLRDRCESLEVQLSEERLKWLGVKANAPLETTSTMVLKNEFKKMMRDTRSESIKAVRAEQEERRRLEGVLRSMKKEMSLHSTPAQTPTKVNGVQHASNESQ